MLDRRDPWSSPGRPSAIGPAARSPEFKAEAVRLCEIGDRSIRQVAEDLDLTETALREWGHRGDIDAGKGPASALTTEERTELARLRRENRQLHMERDI